MMYICDKCFRIYNLFTFTKTNDIYEPIVDVVINCLSNNCDGILFECDELFAPIISILNKKGYKTLYCCSGHIKPDQEIIFNKKYNKKYKNNVIQSYIAFDGIIDFDEIPKGYKLDKDIEDNRTTIRKDFNVNKLAKNLLVDVIHNTLVVLDWVESLPKK